MAGESPEQFYADFSLTRDLPKLEAVLIDKDLLGYAREGKRVWKYLKDQGVSIRHHGTWEVALGYFNRMFGGLQHDDLKGYSFVDVGGGSYDTVGRTYGPDLAKALGHFGADVTIIDPMAQAEDFASAELERITIASETIENFVKQGDRKKASLVTSVSFFGSPSKPVHSTEDSLAVIETLRAMAQLADTQVHVINNYDLINWELLNDLLSKEGTAQELNIKYVGNATMLNSKENKKIPPVDLLIADNRPL